MSDNGYGYFGDGVDGYAHYNQAVNDTKSILDSSVSHDLTQDSTLQQSNGKCRGRTRFVIWMIVLLAWVTINLIVVIAFGDSSIVNITERTIDFIFFTFGEAGVLISVLINVVVLVGFFTSYFTRNSN